MIETSTTLQPATVKIQRTKESLFSRIPAVVLIDSRFVHFYPDDVKEYPVKPGRLTLAINKKVMWSKMVGGNFGFNV